MEGRRGEGRGVAAHDAKSPWRVAMRSRVAACRFSRGDALL